MGDVLIRTERIALDAFLKWAGVVQTGGEAKRLIQAGQVRVNARAERRRGRQLVPGDSVTTPSGETLVVVRQRP
ncbi:MAG TPA: RNA-binding S4 domain-containing protein [bacterium]|jgi:ribosome-associated protein|nr:RNA-binding S4 domain-containing protein [bacterium]